MSNCTTLNTILNQRHSMELDRAAVEEWFTKFYEHVLSKLTYKGHPFRFGTDKMTTNPRRTCETVPAVFCGSAIVMVMDFDKAYKPYVRGCESCFMTGTVGENAIINRLEEEARAGLIQEIEDAEQETLEQALSTLHTKGTWLIDEGDSAREFDCHRRYNHDRVYLVRTVEPGARTGWTEIEYDDVARELKSHYDRD